jgi:hypothetical protein
MASASRHSGLSCPGRPVPTWVNHRVFRVTTPMANRSPAGPDGGLEPPGLDREAPLVR